MVLISIIEELLHLQKQTTETFLEVATILGVYSKLKLLHLAMALLLLQKKYPFSSVRQKLRRKISHLERAPQQKIKL